jgi:hypothetical protein
MDEQTLYERLMDSENLSERMSTPFSNAQVQEIQRNIIDDYAANPVLEDALSGNLSIEDTLDELAQVNKGIRKILPWMKNKEHNSRLEQLGELITKPNQLYTGGIFYPDNIMFGVIVTPLFVFGLNYFLTEYIKSSSSIDNQNEYILNVVIPTLSSLIFTPFASLAMSRQRFWALPRDEAKYIDTKIKELYR